ncbi:MAG TPA: hypothetical protein VL485_01415 [Ktedonobacteraceae bacterium]|nr:hypothetical protein [Ktedonobacteraceae bacterium]
MDQKEESNLSLDDKKSPRRQFFKKMLGVSGAAALTTFAGLTAPEIASAHSLQPPNDLPLVSNLGLFYHLSHPRFGDHFYTTDRSEADNAIRRFRYEDEGPACYVLLSSFYGTVPLYHLHNLNTRDHFYTVDTREANRAVFRLGYQREGIACYVLSDNRIVAFSTPFYRLYDRLGGHHFYTTSTSERDSAVSNGYTDEGVGCYVL